MKRRPARANLSPAYPTDPQFMGRRRILTLLGATVGVAVLDGCLVATSGDMAGPIDGTMLYTAYLPDGTTQPLVFPSGDSLEYVIQAGTLNYQLYSYLQAQVNSLLVSADEVLLSHAFAEFAPGQDHTSVQEELKGVFADAYYRRASAPVTDFSVLLLEISNQTPFRPL